MLLPAAEFGAGDSGSDSDIETVGCFALMEVGDEQPAVYFCPDGIGDAITLVAHDDQSLGGELLGVDVVAVEEGTIDRKIGWQGVEECGQISIYNVHTRDAAHRGLYDLGVPGVDGILAADDGGDAEPVGDADDGSEVAGILHAVEGEDQFIVYG